MNRSPTILSAFGLIASGLLFAGCASVEPTLITMHGGDAAAPAGAETPYVPPPNVLGAAPTPPPEASPAEPMQHHGHGEGMASQDDVKGPSAGEAPAAEAQLAYSCPMHPDIQSSEPGQCPVCGMTLQEREVAK